MELAKGVALGGPKLYHWKGQHRNALNGAPLEGPTRLCYALCGSELIFSASNLVDPH